MRVGIVILPEDRWWAAEPKWRAAEEYGFDHAWTYDHLGWRNLVDGPWFSAMPTLTAAALATSRIRLGTLVASPNYRHPVPFARELITVDDLSDGRFLAGLGAGTAGGSDGRPAYDNLVLGEPQLSARQRADRFTEWVEALDGLLRTDRFDYQGEYYIAVGARNLPGPVQRPRPPFLIAANGPRMMRLAARLGSGWLTAPGRGDGTSEGWWRNVAEAAARFDSILAEQAERAEREGQPPPGPLDRYLNLDSSSSYSLSSVETFTEAAARAGELGFTDIVVHWPRSSEPYHGREAVLEQVVSEVLPRLQGRQDEA